MRYAQIRNIDISNGNNIGIALFVQGCPFRCYNCFNPETWDFEAGKEWDEETEHQFIELAKRPYIKRISILGGEPLADANLSDVLNLINKIRIQLPQKTIWLYTGYTWEECLNHETRREIISKCDIIVDSKYIDSLKNTTLKWRGSSNQRVIDIQKSLKEKRIILYTD